MQNRIVICLFTFKLSFDDMTGRRFAYCYILISISMRIPKLSVDLCASLNWNENNQYVFGFNLIVDGPIFTIKDSLRSMWQNKRKAKKKNRKRKLLADNRLVAFFSIWEKKNTENTVIIHRNKSYHCDNIVARRQSFWNVQNHVD